MSSPEDQALPKLLRTCAEPRCEYFPLEGAGPNVLGHRVVPV